MTINKDQPSLFDPLRWTKFATPVKIIFCLGRQYKLKKIIILHCRDEGWAKNKGHKSEKNGIENKSWEFPHWHVVPIVNFNALWIHSKNIFSMTILTFSHRLVRRFSQFTSHTRTSVVSWLWSRYRLREKVKSILVDRPWSKMQKRYHFKAEKN